MFKPALIIYIACFGLYLLFTRQPDYFDGEMGKGKIHFLSDSTTRRQAAFAIYSTGRQEYSVKADYLFRNYREGEVVDVIYELSQPEKGTVYSWWGYWFTWGEVIFSLVLIVAFYKISHAVTNNPSPESVIEQMEYQPRKRRKYED